MMTIGNFKDYLKTLFPDISFYNGTINKDIECVGVYARNSVASITAIGEKSSYSILPITLLVHWSENSDTCEQTANSIYESLETKPNSIGNKKINQIKLLDTHPIGIGRDDNNICEMSIRLNVFYER